MGTGTWILTGNSSYTGSTTVSDGLLQVGKGGIAGSIGTGTVYLTSTGSILRANRSGTLLLSQGIHGFGSLEVANNADGITILEGSSSSYSGGTTVSSGTLMVRTSDELASPTGSGTLSVLSGGTLAGYGRIAPVDDVSITITGGTLSVGDSTQSFLTAGMLELATSGTGSTTFSGGATVELDLTWGAGFGDNTWDFDAADRLKISGRLSLEDTILKISNPEGMDAWAEGDEWQLFDWSSLTELEGSFASVQLPTLEGELIWDLSRLYSGGVLAIAVVPEPSRPLLLLFGAALSLLRRRRR